MSKQPKEPRGFKRVKKKTEALLENGEKLKALLNSAGSKAKEKQQQLKNVWNDFQTLLRLVKAWWKKDYTQVPWKTILYAATAILYFVSPIDAIPDFIPLSGFIDDISVITFVINSIHGDIKKFEAWEKSQLDEK